MTSVLSSEAPSILENSCSFQMVIELMNAQEFNEVKNYGVPSVLAVYSDVNIGRYVANQEKQEILGKKARSAYICPQIDAFFAIAVPNSKKIKYPRHGSCPLSVLEEDRQYQVHFCRRRASSNKHRAEEEMENARAISETHVVNQNEVDMEDVSGLIIQAARGKDNVSNAGGRVPFKNEEDNDSEDNEDEDDTNNNNNNNSNNNGRAGGDEGGNNNNNNKDDEDEDEAEEDAYPAEDEEEEGEDEQPAGSAGDPPRRNINVNVAGSEEDPSDEGVEDEEEDQGAEDYSDQNDDNSEDEGREPPKKRMKK